MFLIQEVIESNEKKRGQVTTETIFKILKTNFTWILLDSKESKEFKLIYG